MGFSSFLCSKSNQSIPAYPYAGFPAIYSKVRVIFSDESFIEGVYDGYMNVNSIDTEGNETSHDLWEVLRARGLRDDSVDCFKDFYAKVKIVRWIDYNGETFESLAKLQDCDDQGYFYSSRARARILKSLPKPIKKKTYRFYSDPSHGWLRVPLKDILNLGIQDKISSCSYQNGSYAYLEEDCDVSLFLDAIGKDWKEKIKIDEYCTNRRSKIRNYASYSKGNN